RHVSMWIEVIIIGRYPIQRVIGPQRKPFVIGVRVHQPRFAIEETFDVVTIGKHQDIPWRGLVLHLIKFCEYDFVMPAPPDVPFHWRVAVPGLPTLAA